MSFCKSNVPPNTPINILVSKTLYEPGVNFTKSPKSKIILTTNLKCSTNFTKYLTIKLTTNIGPKVKTAPSLT